MRDNDPVVWPVAMLPTIYALPGAKREPATSKWDDQIHGGQSGADVRRHIVLTFLDVLKERLAIRHKPRKEAFEVAPHFRVGVLLNEQRSRGVLEVESDRSFLHFGRGKQRLDFAGQ